MEFEEGKELLEEAEFRRTINVQERMLTVQEQLGEICGKPLEVCEAQRNCEKLNGGFVEKGAILGEMLCENETTGKWSVKILEGVNTPIVWPADDLISRRQDDAIGRLLDTGNNCSEVDKKSDTARLEAALRKVQAKLTLKNEDFNHLEEAYAKLYSEFQLSKLEWEKERLIVHNKISSLQSSLDSQMRISDSLHTKLQMRNQALTHEESRRKLVEVQLSEAHTLFENLYAKCIEEQTKIDQSIAQKDEEVASLRYLLATNDILLKEMEYKNVALKKEKEYMLGSLKEFEEAELKHAASLQTLTNLQMKFENLEKMHGSCLPNLECKEIEWTSQIEQLKAESKGYLSELSNKEKEIYDLRKELEMCRFSLESFNEEMGTLVMLLKSEYSEAFSKLLDEHENNQNQIVMLAKELEDSKNMFVELQRMQSHLEEYVLEVESINKAEMAEKTHEQNCINAELQKSKSKAENLKSSLEEAREILKWTQARLQLQLDNEQAFKQEIESLMNAVREHERNNEVLQQQVTSLESAIVLNDETLKVLELKNKSSIAIIEELEHENICLNEKISALASDWQNIIGEMEGASNELHDICYQDESLLAAFRNTEYATLEKEQRLYEETSSHDERNKTSLFTPTSTKHQTRTNERLPFQEINY